MMIGVIKATNSLPLTLKIECLNFGLSDKIGHFSSNDDEQLLILAAVADLVSRDTKDVPLSTPISTNCCCCLLPTTPYDQRHSMRRYNFPFPMYFGVNLMKNVKFLKNDTSFSREKNFHLLTIS